MKIRDGGGALLGLILMLVMGTLIGIAEIVNAQAGGDAKVQPASGGHKPPNGSTHQGAYAPRSPGGDTISKDKSPWKSLFDGKSLTGWKAINFGGEGAVKVKGGAIVMEQGNDMTGVTYTGGDFPKLNYEVALEGKRLQGKDFFATTTFPVDDSHCSLVTGGWGGTIVGLSNIDFFDASENGTTKFIDFKTDQWYHFRIQVTAQRIQAWIDNKNVVDVATKGKKIATRAECDPCRPFGFATWRTTGAVRAMQVRMLTATEIKAAEEKKKD